MRSRHWNNQGPKTYQIPTAVWKEWSRHFRSLSEALEAGETIEKMNIYGAKYTGVSEYEGKFYVCYQHFEDGGMVKWKCVNFDQFEWINLMESVEAISQAIIGRKRSCKRTAERRERKVDTTISGAKFRYITAGRVVFEDTTWYYTNTGAHNAGREEMFQICQNLGLHVSDLTVEVTNDWVEMPDTYECCMAAHDYLVHFEMNKSRNQELSNAIVGHEIGSDGWKDRVKQSHESVDPAMVSKLLDSMRDFLGLESIHTFTYAMCIHKFGCVEATCSRLVAKKDRVKKTPLDRLIDQISVNM